MFVNAHVHTFRDVDVPRRFLPLGLVRVLADFSDLKICFAHFGSEYFWECNTFVEICIFSHQLN